MSELGDRLREAADAIGAVADEAPEGDFDEATKAEYEEEFGEVPSLVSILRDIERETRVAAMMTEAHEEIEMTSQSITDEAQQDMMNEKLFQRDSRLGETNRDV